MNEMKLADRLGAHVDALVRMGENDMGDLPTRTAGNFHKAVDALRAVHYWIASIEEGTNPDE